MPVQLNEKQKVFLKQYTSLLQEVQESAVYAGECYIQGDDDIADRLLASVSTGLIPYNPENMTMFSIFGSEKSALSRLTIFHHAVTEAAAITEKKWTTAEKMQFLHEQFIPALKTWQDTAALYSTSGDDTDAGH